LFFKSNQSAKERAAFYKLIDGRINRDRIGNSIDENMFRMKATFQIWLPFLTKSNVWHLHIRYLPRLCQPVSYLLFDYGFPLGNRRAKRVLVRRGSWTGIFRPNTEECKIVVVVDIESIYKVESVTSSFHRTSFGRALSHISRSVVDPVGNLSGTRRLPGA
jgi:hypothetical protein